MTASSKGGSWLLTNVDCEFDVIEIAGRSHPVSINSSSKSGQSYVISSRSAWIDYPTEELIRRINPRLQRLVKIACHCVFSPASLLLHFCGFDKAVTVANRLVSTNLYPDWRLTDIECMTAELTTRYAKNPLLIRNICPDVTPELASHLQQAGWQLIPARMVYLCDPQLKSVWKHNHVKKDAKQLNNGEFEVIGPDQICSTDLPRLRVLYRQLFIAKHSQLNPDFTPEFFDLCLESGFLELYGLRLHGELVGVLGLYEHPESHWLTTPLIGYDTNVAQENGIYRCLMAMLLQEAKNRNLRLHYSSGASKFKRARGGEPSLEYTAVFSQHLSPLKRFANACFGGAMQKFAPLILKKADDV